MTQPNKLGSTIHNISQWLKGALNEEARKLFGIEYDDEIYSPIEIEKWLTDSPDSIYVISEDQGKFVMETATPYDITSPPTARYVMPLLEVREVVDTFLPESPYDEEDDLLSECPVAKQISSHSGAVVYASSSVTKPGKTIYKAVAKYVNSLEGNVFVVGDPNFAIAHKTGYKHWYNPVQSKATVAEVGYALDYSDRFIDDDGIESFLHRQRIDHVVYAFCGIKQVKGSQCSNHYLSLIPGVADVEKGSEKGVFHIKGRTFTLSPEPKGVMVCHSNLFTVEFPIDCAVIWYCGSHEGYQVSASMIPVSSTDRFGPVSDYLISDKSDGQIVYLRIRQGIARFSSPYIDGEIKMNCSNVDQDLICELVDPVSVRIKKLDSSQDRFAEVDRNNRNISVKFKELVISEPTFHNRCQVFNEWFKRKEVYHFPPKNRLFERFRVKDWHVFQPEEWRRFAVSGEGVVIKKRLSFIGSKNPYFGKLNSYYLKLPHRLSYEDKIELVGQEFVGLHAIYTDPLKIFRSPGVYEVSAVTNKIFRARDKKEPDYAWYVDIVRNSPSDLRNIFSLAGPEFFFVRRAGGGITEIRTSRRIRLQPRQIIKMDRSNNQGFKYYVKPNVECEVGDYILVNRKTYKVVKFKQKGMKLQLLES